MNWSQLLFVIVFALFGFGAKMEKKKTNKKTICIFFKKHFNSWAGFVANGIFPIIIFRVFVLMFMLKGK